MKKSIRSIAAAAAALTMALSCVPVSVYAAKDTPAVQAEEENAVKYEFTEGKTIKAPYDGTPFFVNNDGVVYYWGSDSNKRQIIFTLDESGKVKNSYTFKSYVNDDGITITSGATSIKQIGNYLYLIGGEYDEESWFIPQTKNNVIFKLDTELNEIARYKFDKKFRNIDTNGEKVVYIKGSLTNQNIYVCDMDGKNKKLLYSTSINMDPVEQGTNSIAIAGNYVGFQRRTGYSNASNYKTYCGIIDIETGEVTLHEERSVEQVFSSNGYLVWYGDDGYYPDPEGTFNNVSSDVFAGGAVAADKYFRSRYKKYDDSEIYVFDGENYSVIKSPDIREQGYNFIIDNEGNRITTSYDGKGNQIYRIYHDGKLMDEIKVDYKGSSKIYANGGVMTLCYTGRNATSEDWIGWNDTTPQEEIEAMRKEQDERAAKLKEQYPMRSVTYTYKS